MEIILKTSTEVEINITSNTDEYGYTVLDDCFVGAWHASTISTTDGNVVIVGSGRPGTSDS